MEFLTETKNKEKKQTLPEVVKQRNHYSFLVISPHDAPSTQEMNRHHFYESNDNMYIVDIPDDKILYRKDGKVDVFTMSNIGFVMVVEKAPEIISEMFYFMEGKTNPKDIVMPIRAAIDAGAIRKPTPSEFDKVFGNSFIGPITKGLIKTKSSLDYYCDLNNSPYYSMVVFNKMVERFKAIIAN